MQFLNNVHSWYEAAMLAAADSADVLAAKEKEAFNQKVAAGAAMSAEQKAMIILPPVKCKCGQMHLTADECDTSK